MRYGHYASLSSQPPGAVIIQKAVLQDECAIPPYNWRIPYVVVYGPPASTLRSLVYTPEEVLRRGTELRLNYLYYITKCINPALDRVLSLCGGQVGDWFRSVARPKLRVRHFNYDVFATAATVAGDGSRSGTTIGGGCSSASGSSTTATTAYNNTSTTTTNTTALATTHSNKHKQTSMDQFTIQSTCIICSADAVPQHTLCHNCRAEHQQSLCNITNRLKILTLKDQNFTQICKNCTKTSQYSVLYSKNEIIGIDNCESIDCKILYERNRIITKLEDLSIAVQEINQFEL